MGISSSGNPKGLHPATIAAQPQLQSGEPVVAKLQREQQPGGRPYLSVVFQPAAHVAAGLGHHHHVVHDGQVHKRLQRCRQLDVAADGVLLQGAKFAGRKGGRVRSPGMATPGWANASKHAAWLPHVAANCCCLAAAPPASAAPHAPHSTLQLPSVQPDCGGKAAPTW